MIQKIYTYMPTPIQRFKCFHNNLLMLCSPHFLPIILGDLYATTVKADSISVGFVRHD